ncbi:MAG: MFS transporter, partial [Promethearchaeota archaeon]
TRAFNGLGIGAIVPTIFSLVGDLVPKERRSTSFSYITIAMLIGQMMGLAIASIFTTEWRSIYLILGLSNLGVTFLILTIKEPKRGSAEEELKEVILEGAEYNFKWKKEDLKELWANKSNFWLVVNFIDTFPGSIIIFLIFKYMEDLHNMKEEPVTIMIFLVAIFGAIGTYIFGRLGDVIFKKDRRGKVAVALFCNIFPIIFVIIFLELKFWLPDNATLGDVFQNRGALTAIIMIVITMFINQGVGPNWYSSLTDINLPEHRGTMISFASFMDMIGNAVGPLIGSYIATKLDITAAMWSANIFWIINVLLWVPVFFYIEKDLDRMHNILEERAEELKKSA